METFVKHNMFINFKILEIQHFKMWTRFGEDGHRAMMNIRVNKSVRSWIWDQYLPEKMEWKFGK